MAVLPFDNRSADEEDAEFFAAGVHDELLTLLSRLGDLKVISRTSVERIDETLTVPEIGELLGVATVVEGQVQRAGNQLRINVQLIDAADEDHLWANIYDRELTAENVFEVQSDIARMIAEALQAELSPSEEKLLAAIPTQNTDALDKYLMGRQLTNRSTYDSLRQAQVYLDEAVRLDPDFAEARVANADNYAQALQTGAISIQEYIDGAEPHVQRALALDNQLPETWAQQGNLLWKRGKLEEAEAAYLKALGLNPGDPRSLEAFGHYLRTTGRPLEAIPVLKEALIDDPLSANLLFELGKAQMYAGEPEKFAANSRRILEIDPANALGRTGLIQAALWTGRLDEMFPWYIGALEADPGDYETWGHFAMHLQSMDMTELVKPYLMRATEIGAGEPAVLKCQAMVLWMQGRVAEATELAHRSLEADIDDRWGSRNTFLRLVRDEALQSGDHQVAIDWFLSLHAELFGDSPQITIDNINEAANLALLLRSAGHTEAADGLIRAGLDWHRENQVPGVHGYLIGVVDVELLALAGREEEALDTLISAVDKGWRATWGWNLGNPNLDSIRDGLAFQVLVNRIEADLAEQVTAIRALPDQGEMDLRTR